MVASEKVLVLDTGGYSIKAGYATDRKPRIIPNAIFKSKNERKRVFIGNEIDELNDYSSLFYMLPFQKGYLVNWDVQRKVWDYLLGKDVFKVSCEETALVLTEPYFNFQSIQEALDEIFFEEYGFTALLRVSPATLSAYHWASQHPGQPGALIVDSGYSFSHIVPFFNGHQLKESTIRISVGGKAMTNHLKEIISYRQLHVLDETYVMNQCKEDSCYVSLNFWEDMKISRLRGMENTIQREYVLPDFSSIKKGYLRIPGVDQSTDSEQGIKLANERFAAPELLFHPSDAGIDEVGIPEAISHAVSKSSDVVQSHLYENIVLTGGNCLFPGIRERLETEIRASCLDDYDVKVSLPDDSIGYAWKGGVELSKTPYFEDMVVSRRDYDEYGSKICEERFTA